MFARCVENENLNIHVLNSLTVESISIYRTYIYSSFLYSIHLQQYSHQTLPSLTYKKRRYEAVQSMNSSKNLHLARLARSQKILCGTRRQAKTVKVYYYALSALWRGEKP